MLHRTMSYQEMCISTRSNTARRSMPRTPLPSRCVLRSLVTLSATPSPPSSHGPILIDEDFSAVLDSTCRGHASTQVRSPRVPRIQIDYPATSRAEDREVIAAELFEQDRWGRTVTLEKRDLSHHRQVSLRFRPVYDRVRPFEHVPLQDRENRHRPPRGRDPVRSPGPHRGL